MENVKENRYGEAYQVGYEEGIRYGGCQAVLERIPPVTRPKVDLRVLYVPQGFDAIDEGVQAALKELTRECVVASPEMMLQETLRVHPDLVLVMNSLHVFPPDHASQMAQIRSMGIRTAVWFVDDPYFTDDSIELALSYDVVFTHEIECVPLYRSIGVRSVYHLPLAANPHQFRPIPAKPEYRYDVCFIGNAFWNRVGLFDRLSSFLQDKRVLIAGFHWDRLPRYEQLSRFIRPGWVPVEETVRYYNASKIVLNIHRPTQAGQDNRNGRDTPGDQLIHAPMRLQAAALSRSRTSAAIWSPITNRVTTSRHSEMKWSWRQRYVITSNTRKNDGRLPGVRCGRRRPPIPIRIGSVVCWTQSLEASSRTNPKRSDIMFIEEADGQMTQTVLDPAESGRKNGLRDGYAEGYLRGEPAIS